MRIRTGIATLLAAFALLAFADVRLAHADDGSQPTAKRQRFIKVKRIKPRHGKKFVDPTTEVRIRFSRPVNRASITPSTIHLCRLNGTARSWNARFEKNDRVLVLSPTAFFEPGTDYQVRIRFGIQSVDGRVLKREKQANFFTDPTFEQFAFLHPEQFRTLTSAMFEGRAAHTATRMRDGTVLLAGGQTDFVQITDTADVFDPASDEFRAVGSRLIDPRAFHTSAELGGAVMLLGGFGGPIAAPSSLASTEIYDPSARAFRPGPPMLEERDFIRAINLADGRIFVMGGLSYGANGAEFSLDAEIYDVARGEWRVTRSRPNQRRAGHTMTLLDDGRVLIVGGDPPGSPSGATAELFDPSGETFTFTTSPPTAGLRSLHTATYLEGGAVLIADGGQGKLELYDSTQERFFDAGGASFVRRTFATATRLPSNRVLIVGGFDKQGDNFIALSSMDLYLPDFSGTGTGRVVRTQVVLEKSRSQHTATALRDGRILFAGGFTEEASNALNTGVVFTPE